MSILSLVLAGVLSSHIFGVKMFELTKAKLGASSEARRAVKDLGSEVRGAKMIQIGTGDLSSFTKIADGQAQQGSAIQIYMFTNTNSFIRYFWNASTKELQRLVSGSSTSSLVARCVTNSLVFTAEDFAGNVLTNNQNNRVIGLSLQFYQIQYPVTPIGPGSYYDFYQLRTRVTRRALE